MTITLQFGNTRYTFIKDTREDGTRYQIRREYMMSSGSSVSVENTTKEKGNKLYKELIAKGFHQFRNVHEVSWYATVKNNTPYAEVWKTEGKYFIPLCSRVLN